MTQRATAFGVLETKLRLENAEPSGYWYDSLVLRTHADYQVTSPLYRFEIIHSCRYSSWKLCQEFPYCFGSFVGFRDNINVAGATGFGPGHSYVPKLNEPILRYD